MKNSAGKRIAALVLCLALLIVVQGIDALAVDASKYANLQYQSYTYLGDSISWGYGLNENIEHNDKFSVAIRVPGSFPDVVASVLEKNNQIAVHPASSSGSRLSDYRYLLEDGMGKTNSYKKENDWYGARHPERTEQLLKMGTEICGWIQESDLITLQGGVNDIAAALVNSALATGVIDLDKIENISDFEGVLDYLTYALEGASKNPDIIGSFVKTFTQEIKGFLDDASAVVQHVVALAPEDADILVVGYYHAMNGMRLIPGTSRSLVFELVDKGIDMFNNIYRMEAEKYNNVEYVDAPNATILFSEGTTFLDAASGGLKGFRRGIHPDFKGHEYIATCVLDKLNEINQVDSTATDFFEDVHPSDWFYPYVKYVYENGLFTGTTETTFEPNAAMTRGMFATVLWAREGKPQSGKTGFEDLTADWYRTAVSWAEANGIVGGYSDTIFGPNDPVTREQMVAIMYQYAKYKNYDTKADGKLDRFADKDAMSDYAETAMKWAVGHKIITGTGDGLEPKGTATRAQVAVVLKAFDENVK